MKPLDYYIKKQLDDHITDIGRQLDGVDTISKAGRAKEIAQLSNDPKRWHSHGRGIDLFTLKNELNLEIENYSKKIRHSAIA